MEGVRKGLDLGAEPTRIKLCIVPLSPSPGSGIYAKGFRGTYLSVS